MNFQEKLFETSAELRSRAQAIADHRPGARRIQADLAASALKAARERSRARSPSSTPPAAS